MKLILFDIDGTLLLTDGAGRRALHRALIGVFGETGPAGHPFDGKTDPLIVRELMGFAGRTDEEIAAGMALVFEAYIGFLREDLREPGFNRRALKGVPALLDAIEDRDDAVLGLLTGNIEPGARAKLESVGIDPERFVVGAYGSDHERRTELPAIAQRRLREQRGLDVRGSDIIVIGDTPFDIECGRALGVHSVGVATGSHTVAELAACGPGSVFSDLGDTKAVLDAIFGLPR